MVALFGTFNNQCTFFRRGSADDVHFSRIISYDGTLAVFWIKPPLRLSGTSSQGEAFSAPIEGSCRQSRLRGHKIFTYQQRNVDCIIKYRNVLKITQKKRRPTVAPTLPKNYSSPSSIASLCESDILPVFLSTSITLTFSQSPSLTTSSTFSTL